MDVRTLVALKPFTYATRSLVPGDEFEVQTVKHARILLAMKRVKYKEVTGPEPSAEASSATAAVPDDGKNAAGAVDGASAKPPASKGGNKKPSRGARNKARNQKTPDAVETTPPEVTSEADETQPDPATS